MRLIKTGLRKQTIEQLCKMEIQPFSIPASWITGGGLQLFVEGVLLWIDHVFYHSTL